MDGFLGRMGGELLIGASTIPGEYMLPALIGRFREKFPEISITLLIGDSQAAVDWVGEGRAELAVVGARLGHRTVEYRELAADDLVVAMPAGHRWRGRAHVSVEELRAEPLLLRERGSGTRAALERALGNAQLGLAAFRIVGEMGSTQAIKQAVKAGIGVSVVSARAVAEECASGVLACARIADLPVARSFYVATHRERSRSPLAEAFRTFIEAEAS
jgi:DNA-binding transcriptional LysR family regulator